VSKVGPRRPPAASRFRKGVSGNPKGRPRGARKEASSAFDIVIDRTLTVTQNGEPREVTVEEARAARGAKRAGEIDTIVRVVVSPGSVNSALEPLRMAAKLDRYRETARMALEPWLVEMALARFGERRLSREEQAMVVRVTRTAHKVRWPDWWEVMP